MNELAHRLRLPWIAAWIVGILLGQVIVLQTGWGHAVGSVFVLWRILVMVVAYILFMLLIDAIWKRPATEARSIAREFVDALILGFFVGLAIAS